MTTLHAKSRPDYATYCRQTEADCEALAKRKRQRELKWWSLACLVLFAAVALVWRLW